MKQWMLNNEFQWAESPTELADNCKRNTLQCYTSKKEFGRWGNLYTLVNLEQRVVNTSVIIEHFVKKENAQQLSS